ncbi:MAG: hypothetical protein IH605_17220 [Burkholderiales bacterium]|nr:hypothetical protein [Burkholderiales bacterium]
MVRLIVAFVLACACSLALAQNRMYRCGNQFQERPCAGPKIDADALSATKADSQEQQESAARRREREQAVLQAKCQNYAEELADVDRRIKSGADKEVLDQFTRRQREMRARIDRTCK